MTVLNIPRNCYSLISVSFLSLRQLTWLIIALHSFIHRPTVSLQYEPRPRLGRAPTPRGYHASLLSDSRLFIFGGFNGHDVFDDVHILDLAAAAYLPQVTSFSIDAQ